MVLGFCRSPRAAIALSAVANASCSLQNASYAGRVLRIGGANIKPSSEACWKDCKCAPPDLNWPSHLVSGDLRLYKNLSIPPCLL